MLLTIFKYLWILPVAFIYIVWTIFAVKALIRFLINRKKYKNVSFWSDDYEALFIWVVVHLILMFCASFVYFIAGQ